MNSLLTKKRKEGVANTAGTSVLTGVSGGSESNQQFLEVMSLPPDPPHNNNDVILNLIFNI